MRRKTRECPRAFCTFSSCRRLRGVACQNLRKKKRFNTEYAESAEFTEKSGGHFSVRASKPGGLRPPSNLREAPPPGGRCDILFATPALWVAAPGVPPPTLRVGATRGGGAS